MKRISLYKDVPIYTSDSTTSTTPPVDPYQQKYEDLLQDARLLCYDLLGQRGKLPDDTFYQTATIANTINDFLSKLAK